MRLECGIGTPLLSANGDRGREAIRDVGVLPLYLDCCADSRKSITIQCRQRPQRSMRGEEGGEGVPLG